jgi:hypothetical protein
MNPQDNEQLRLAVRDVLYARQGTALPAHGIRRRVATEIDFKCELPDVEAALEFWRSFPTGPQVAFDFDEAGNTKWYRITAAGILAKERA